MAVKWGQRQAGPSIVIVNSPLAILQCTCYFISVFCGLLIAILVGTTMTNFGYTCVLGAEIVWKITPTLYHGSESTCNFIIYFNIGCSIFYALVVGLFLCFILCARVARRNQVQLYETLTLESLFEGLNNVFSFINGFVCILALGAASIFSSGFFRLCYSITTKWNLDSCADAQGHERWKGIYVLGGDTNPNSDTFYICLLVAVLLSWINTLVWLALFCMSCMSCCRPRCGADCWDPDKDKRYKAEKRANVGVYGPRPLPRRTIDPNPNSFPMRQIQPPHGRQAMHGHGRPPARPHQGYPQAMAAPPPVYTETKQPLYVDTPGKQPLPSTGSSIDDPDPVKRPYHSR